MNSIDGEGQLSIREVFIWSMMQLLGQDVVIRSTM